MTNFVNVFVRLSKRDLLGRIGRSKGTTMEETDEMRKKWALNVEMEEMTDMLK
jgi:hypothetical protein